MSNNIIIFSINIMIIYKYISHMIISWQYMSYTPFFMAPNCSFHRIQKPWAKWPTAAPAASSASPGSAPVSPALAKRPQAASAPGHGRRSIRRRPRRWRNPPPRRRAGWGRKTWRPGATLWSDSNWRTWCICIYILYYIYIIYILFFLFIDI